MSSYKSYTDYELVRLLEDGDVSAFSEIYFRYADAVYQQAYRILRNREETKDVVQDIFASLWNKKKEIQVSNLAGYLYIATRNQLIKIMAHKKVAAGYLDWLQVISRQEDHPTDYPFREKQLQTFIDREIDKLPSKMRQVFNLSRKANLSHKEIALKLHLSEATVKTQVKNALRTLKRKLETFLFF